MVVVSIDLESDAALACGCCKSRSLRPVVLVPIVIASFFHSLHRLHRLSACCIAITCSLCAPPPCLPPGRTLLHIVCADPIVTKDLLKLLLEARADPNLPDKNGRTALHVVLMNKPHRRVNKCVRALLEAGANANLVSGKGELPLVQSFYMRRKKKDGHLKIAEMLVRSGNINLDIASEGELHSSVLQLLCHCKTPWDSSMTLCAWC